MTPTLSHERAWELLPDYVDGYLSDEERAAMKEHLGSCETCRNEVAEIEGLLAEARQLPESIEPERDLWPGIAERIAAPDEADSRAEGPATAGSWWSRLLASLRPKPIVWTSLALGATAVLAVLLLTGREPGPAPGIGPAQGDPTTQATLAALESECRMNEDQILAVAADTPADPGGGTLDLIRANLRTVDLAIGQAREAWQANPHSPHLTRMVIAAYQAKAALLGDAQTMLRTT